MYLISFAMPVNSSPTLQVGEGSVTWQLKAVVHRPCTLKTKVIAAQVITAVASPGEADTEHPVSIVIERRWDTQMQYLIISPDQLRHLGWQGPHTTLEDP